jgi:hypothetical protein
MQRGAAVIQALASRAWQREEAPLRPPIRTGLT